MLQHASNTRGANRYLPAKAGPSVHSLYPICNATPHGLALPGHHLGFRLALQHTLTLGAGHRSSTSLCVPFAGLRQGSVRLRAQSSSSSAHVAGDQQLAMLGNVSIALALAWVASQRRSLFAATCCVETAVQLYREGRGFEEVQMNLQLATGRDGGLLNEQECSILVSWVALVFLTLEELGVPRDLLCTAPGASASMDEELASKPMAKSPYLEGMLQYVRQTLAMQESGTTLAMLSGFQDLARQGDTSPTVQLMQQYTRLVMLTVEVAAAMKLPGTHDLGPPSVVTQITEYTLGFMQCAVPLDGTDAASTSSTSSSSSGRQVPATSSGSTPVAASSPPLYVLPPADGPGLGLPSSLPPLTAYECPSPRGLAVRLLVSFMGAVFGSLMSLKDFVASVATAYSLGIAAGELLSELHEEEFLQSGGLLPVGLTQAQGGDGPKDVNKVLFARWLSLSYMALAQLGVAYPAATTKDGWAWAGVGDALEALDLAAFTENTLKRVAQQQQQQQQASEADPLRLIADLRDDSAASPSPSNSSSSVGGDSSVVTPPSPLPPSTSSTTSSEPSQPTSSSPAAATSPPLPGPAPPPALPERLRDHPEALAAMEAERQAALAALRQGVVRGRDMSGLFVRLADSSLAGSSSSLLVVTQQAALLEAMYMHVQQQQQQQQ